ncbi:MAG: hypothetical protein AAGA76_01185 [Pseudomonadota bacterium]
MDGILHEHKVQGNSLKSLGFLVAAIAAVLVGMNAGAPIYWYIPIGFVLLFVSWHFMSNPNHGSKLTNKTLEYWSGKTTKQFDLADIDHLEITSWMDGPSDFVIKTSDGSVTPLSYLCIGDSDTFAEALQKAGLSVEKKC